MIDSVKGKVAAALAMVACCGLSMAVALGLIAISSTLLFSGVGVAVAIGCIFFMFVVGHRHHHGLGDAAPERPEETSHLEPSSR